MRQVWGGGGGASRTLDVHLNDPWITQDVRPRTFLWSPFCSEFGHALMGVPGLLGEVLSEDLHASPSEAVLRNQG